MSEGISYKDSKKNELLNALLQNLERDDQQDDCERHERDRLNFVESLSIVSKAKDVARLKLNRAQRQVWETIEELRGKGKPLRLIILKARQEGVSTQAAAIIFEDTDRRPNLLSVVIAHEAESSAELFEKYRFFQQSLPEGQARGLDRCSLRVLEYAKPHGSKITVRTAGNVKTARGMTITNLHASEVAFWPDAETLMTGLEQCVPDSPDTLIIKESTANGVGNYFWREYWRAKNGESDYTAVFLPWFLHEDYTRPIEDAASFALSPEERQLKERFGLSDAQLNWRRWAIANKCQGRTEVFQQEYPASEEEAFLTTGSPAFNREALQRHLLRCRPPTLRGSLKWKEGRVGGEVELVPDPWGALQVWDEPRPRENYAIGCDPADAGQVRGEDQNTDYSVIEVLHRGQRLRQVAEWHGRIDSDLLADELHKLAVWYNSPFVGVEIDGPGISVLRRLYKVYRFVYLRETLDETTEGLSQKLGWRTNRQTRPILLDDLEHYIREFLLEINSQDLVRECLTFVKVRGKWQATDGCHDDRVMAAGITIQMHKLTPLRHYDEPEELEFGSPNAYWK
ncbi:MAG: hypothetical protein V2A77_01025 [Pseudomonadota bacterium]